MDITGSVFLFLRDEHGELLDQRNCEIAGIRGRSSERSHIVKFGTAFRFNRWSGRGGNKSGARLGSRQGRFEIEHPLQRGAIGENSFDGLRTKQRVEQVHALSVITPDGETKRFRRELARAKFGGTRQSVTSLASRPFGLNALKDDSNTLSHPDAHGAERILTAAAQQLVRRRGNKARAAGTQRMAERNRAAVGIHARGIVSYAKFTENSERLGCKGFIQFDDVHLTDRQICFGKNLSRSGGGPHAHDAWRDANCSSSGDARLGNQTMPLGCGFRSQKQRASAIVYAGSVSRGHRTALFHDPG